MSENFTSICTIDRASVSQEARTVSICFSSETPCWEESVGAMVILDHSPGCCDTSRMEGGPVLLGHDAANPDNLVATAERVTIGPDGKGRAIARFSKSKRADEIFQDVMDGIRKQVSVRAELLKLVLEKVVDGVKVLRATSWRPVEVSLVAIGKDPNVGVNRSADKSQQKITYMNTTDPKSEIAEIMATGKQFGLIEDAAGHIAEGRSLEAFRTFALEKIRQRSVPAYKERVDPNVLGMTTREKDEFSIQRALQTHLATGRFGGFELEVSQTAQKAAGHSVDPTRLLIPADVLQHTAAQATRSGNSFVNRTIQTSGSATYGGNTVATDLLTGSWIDLLRAKTVCIELGAQVLTGLPGNAAVPKVSSDATATWETETSAVADSSVAFGQLLMSPKRLTSLVPLSKLLILQSAGVAEMIIRHSLAQIVAAGLDLGALAGSGSANQPTGILNTSGIGAITFGGAATFAKIVEFETDVAAANADSGSIAYITSSASRGKLKQLPIIGSTFPKFVWEGTTMNGYNAAVANAIPSNRMIYGNFNDLIIGFWQPLELFVDPYTRAAENTTRIIATSFADIGVRHAGSFAASTDSAAQ